MKLLVAGGGTGGHLFPGIAVAEEFISRDPSNRVLFVGTERGIEARLLPRLGYRLELVQGAGIRGKGSLAKIKGALLFLSGYAESRKILKEFRPDFVLGVGGYASAPIVAAARGLQIPRFVHEQNAIPGFTNKGLSKIADRVFVSLEEAMKFFPKEKTLLTGNPLRRQILDSIGEEAAEDGDAFRLLVFGGSLGAHAINMTMTQALPHLEKFSDRLRIMHQTGEKDLAAVREAYASSPVDAEVVPFIDDMAAAYRSADLIICRAGATTIAEVTACGKPCIFVPFPYAVDDHQRRNAEALLKKDAAEMIIERELTPEKLAETVTGLISHEQRRKRMGENARQLGRLDAAKVIVDEMIGSATGR